MQLVSVIVPNYNHAKYLKERIDSILNQTYQNLELIILDDCSTDNSREIINSYHTHPFVTHIILNEYNSGSPFIQWQKGFDLATGDIIWIAESDDFADHKFLEKLVPELINNENIGVVFTDSNQVDAQETIHYDFYKKHRNKIFETKKWDNDYQSSGIEELKENLFYDCTINNTSAMLFKKALLKKIDFIFLSRFKYCGDWFFFISLMTQTNISYKHEPLSYYRVAVDNFKPGTRSTLNYLKERFFARYYFWKDIKHTFSNVQRDKLYKELGMEMRVQLSGVILGKINLKDTIQVYKKLYNINRGLFLRQFFTACKSYIRKK